MAVEKVTVGGKVRTNPLIRHGNTINDVLDVVDRYRREAIGLPTSARLHTPSTDVVYVKNMTGADRSLGDVVQLGAYLLDEVQQNSLWFEGETPEIPLTPIVILRQPAKANDVVPASASGVWIANVNITTTTHRFARPARTSHVLTSDASGGPIELLSTATTTGQQLLPVRFRQNVLEIGKITGTDLAAGGSCTVTIWRRNTSNVLTATTETVTAYDWMLATGYELVANVKVVIAFINLEWYVIAADNCPTVA